MHYKSRHPEKLKPSDFPFKCEKCFKTFAISRTLKNHIRTAHAATTTESSTTVTQFVVQCNTCNKNFVSEDLLKKHISIEHVIVKKHFECLFCKRIYAHRGDVNRHMKVIHKMELKRMK